MTEKLTSDKHGMSEEYTKDVDMENITYCDPCKDYDTHIPATGFCVDCNDFLCADCFQAHKRNRLSRNHVLKGKENIQKLNLKDNVPKEKCQAHKNEAINWFCENHDSIMCDVCKRLDHRKCTQVKLLREVSQNFLTSDKLKQVTERLGKLRKDLKEKLPSIKQNEVDIEKYYTGVIAKITRHISKIKDEDMAKIKALEETCDVSVTRINSMLNTIETLKQNGKESQAFIATKKAESEIKTFDERFNSVKEDNQITKYRYIPNPKVSTDGVLGKICDVKVKIDPFQLDEINVKTPSDTSNCTITGMERLPHNRLVIADRNNNKIKLIDETARTVTSELKLDVDLWDLVMIDSNNIAVTTRSSEKLLFVSLSDGMTVDKTIDKTGYSYCQGIVYSTCTNTLTVSYYPEQIEILNMDETVKQVIEKNDKHGTVRFCQVPYITQGLETNILYLSEYTNHRVSSMTQDGQVISSFTHEHLRYPTGITVGRDGRIFVCSYSSNKIFEISSDLSVGRVILDEKDGILSPRSIVYSEDKYKLFVNSSNTIKVFLV